MEGKMNLQDTFLNEARKENVPVSIFLLSGVQLKGKVKSFDSFTVLLVSENRSQLIYKHAIYNSKDLIIYNEYTITEGAAGSSYALRTCFS